MKKLIGLSLTALTLALAGCGGGGGGGSSNSGGTTPPPPPPSIPPSSQSAQQCAPDNPYKADAATATTAGSLTLEKQWMRSYFDEAYLWYDTVPTVDPAATTYSGSMTALDGRKVPQPLSNYFEALKTKTLSASGNLTDKFSFTYPTKAWNDLSSSGISAGYGVEWVAYNSTNPNRLWRVSEVQPGSPAATAGVRRGDTIKTVDGVDFANGTDVATINAGMFPTLGTRHTLVFSRAGTTDLATSMVGSSITSDPVPIASVNTDSAGRKVGYIQFDSHIATSETKLIDAVNNLKTANISDLVLDLRYNGGGYLYLASELTYMIAGATKTNGKYFEKLQYNAKRTADNAQAPTPFYNTSCIPDANFNCTKQQALPTLGLSRVFLIVTGDTCSASESIINGLRGVDVEVQLIGSTTCGKPYGFTAKDNCGVSYFPIEFKGINYKGFGDYPDGFTPTTGTTSNTNLPGCTTTDDLDHALGDKTERMFSAALTKAASGSCPAAASGVSAPSRLQARTGMQNQTDLHALLIRDNPLNAAKIVVPLKR